MSMRERPPIGVMPEWLWKEQHPHETATEHDYMLRNVELEAAILRYLEVGMLPRTEWVNELGAAAFAAGVRFAEARQRSPEPSRN